MNDVIPFLRDRLRPHRATVLVLLFLALIAAIFETAIPLLYGRAVDALIGKNINPLLYLLSGWLVLRLLTDLLRRSIAFRGRMLTYQSAQGINRESVNLFLSLPVSFHLSKKSGETQQTINELRNGFERVLNHGLFDLFPGVLTVVGITGYLTYLDVRLGALNVLVMALFLWRANGAIPRLDAAWDTNHAADRAYHGQMWDALRNASAVKANSAEKHVQRVLKGLEGGMVKSYVNLEKLHVARRREEDIIFGVGTVALFALAALSVMNDTMTPGTVTAVLGYSFTTWGMVRSFLWIRWDMIALGSRIREYRAMTESPRERFGVGRKAKLKGAVAYEGVRFRYRDGQRVLEDVSFNIRPGETVAIVGESGQGKTTIVELLYRLYEPQAGRILVDGSTIQDLELSSLRSQLAYVPQDLTLFHDNIRENIRIGRSNATNREVERAAKQAAIHEWITSLPEGYETKVGERGLRLSAGQRQRIAIARAFLRNPAILILDEPTSSLDAKTEMLIQNSLKNLLRGRTTIIIAHRLRTVQEADRIFVLHDGRIVESGRHDELIAQNGMYQRLRELQFAV